MRKLYQNLTQKMAKAEDKDAAQSRMEAALRNGCAVTGGGEGPKPTDAGWVQKGGDN